MELSSLIWLLYFQEVTFHARKMKNPTLKKFLIFREMELSSFNPEKKNLGVESALGRCTHLEILLAFRDGCLLSRKIKKNLYSGITADFVC